MAVNSPRAREPAPVEEPSPRAKLRIRVGHAWPPDRAKRRASPDQINYAIMTCGVLGSVITGTAGVVLTLRVAPGRTGLARAELIMAMAAACVIAAGRRTWAAAGHKADRGQASGNR
jgi:hypothetical protein